MSTPLTDTIENLTSYINEITGGEDTNLSDAVATLADGYGKYSIDDLAIERNPRGAVTVNVDVIGASAFSGNPFITSISGPNVTRINGSAFIGCSKLTSIDFPKLVSVGGYAFQALPISGDLYLPSLKTIEISGFNRIAITHLNLPAIVTLEGQNIFRDCSSLETVYLASVTTINGNVFYNDTSITDIYLPNAESTYSGAPWGATNAIIHYNTQFDENGEPILE